MPQNSESQDNPPPPPNVPGTPHSHSAIHEGGTSGVDRSALKKYALCFLRLPATVFFLARRYLGIAFLKARIQWVRHFSLSAAFRSLGRAAYSKQAAADSLATQFAEIKEVEAKLDEKQKPTTADGDNSTGAKIGLKFKNLLRRLQTIPLSRRLNHLLVSLGKRISTDEAVGASFFNEWSNLTAVKTKMAALKERDKAFAECVPSETDFSWWPRTIPGCLTVLALLGAVLWQPQHRLYGITLAYFLISGSRYLWFSMTVPADQRPKLKWWRTPGAVAAFVCVVLAVNAPHAPISSVTANAETTPQSSSMKAPAFLPEQSKKSSASQPSGSSGRVAVPLNEKERKLRTAPAVEQLRRVLTQEYPTAKLEFYENSGVVHLQLTPEHFFSFNLDRMDPFRIWVCDYGTGKEGAVGVFNDGKPSFLNENVRGVLKSGISGMTFAWSGNPHSFRESFRELILCYYTGKENEDEKPVSAVANYKGLNWSVDDIRLKAYEANVPYGYVRYGMVEKGRTMMVTLGYANPTLEIWGPRSDLQSVRVASKLGTNSQANILFLQYHLRLAEAIEQEFGDWVRAQLRIAMSQDEPRYKQVKELSDGRSYGISVQTRRQPSNPPQPSYTEVLITSAITAYVE